MSNLLDTGYYDENDLKHEGFRRIGSNVKIAKNTTIVGIKNISIGNNVRIDGYCTIVAPDKGYIALGSFIHIAGYCLLSAGDGIIIKDFAGVSHGCRIYSRSDDFSGEYLTGPTVSSVSKKYTSETRGEVQIGRHVVLGSGCVVLPNVKVEEGTTVGALSLVNRSLSSWSVYAGCPATKIKDRSKNLLMLEKQFLNELAMDSEK